MVGSSRWLKCFTGHEPSIQDCSTIEVIGGLSAQGVTAAGRLPARRDGILKPTNTWILTFARPTVPLNVIIEY